MVLAFQADGEERSGLVQWWEAIGSLGIWQIALVF
jgi:hypothetical protein